MDRWWRCTEPRHYKTVLAGHRPGRRQMLCHPSLGVKWWPQTSLCWFSIFLGPNLHASCHSKTLLVIDHLIMIRTQAICYSGQTASGVLLVLKRNDDIITYHHEYLIQNIALSSYVLCVEEMFTKSTSLREELVNNWWQAGLGSVK